MNGRRAEITKELEAIFSDHSPRIGSMPASGMPETSGGNAPAAAQDKKFAESDRLLEQMLAIPAKSMHGWRLKAVALLRHIENQRPAWPHRYPDSELARKALQPLLEDFLTASLG